jgi:hypothetical protein
LAVTTFWYAPAFISAFSKGIDFTSETKINALLTTVTYAPNQDTHQYHSSVTNQLSTANGYTAEDGSDTGLSLTSTTVTNTNNVITLDTIDPAWTATGAGFSASIIVLLDVSSGVSATDPLILWSDFGEVKTASGGGTFTYVVAGTGWATITAADATGFP